MKLLSRILIIFGCLLIVSSVILLIWIFAPVAGVEVNYNLNKPKATINQIKPIDKDFGIVIPKIGANAKIIANVDPFDSRVYQVALTKGVAQAAGTVLPDETGNMFLFSHSSANLLEATRYNSVFYLLSKLKNGDEIYIFYKKLKYKYVVTDIKIVDPKDVSYLSQSSFVNHQSSSLTLMTCWPAGTDYKRLIVIATSK